MPLIPTRSDVKPKVVTKILAACSLNNDSQITSLKESDNLENDLGMSGLLKQAMCVPYSKISHSYPQGIPVSGTAAGNCETVKDAIDLVFSRAKGTK